MKRFVVSIVFLLSACLLLAQSDPHAERCYAGAVSCLKSEILGGNAGSLADVRFLCVGERTVREGIMDAIGELDSQMSFQDSLASVYGADPARSAAFRVGLDDLGRRRRELQRQLISRSDLDVAESEIWQLNYRLDGGAAGSILYRFSPEARLLALVRH